MITNELKGERIDVIPYSDDPIELIQNALAPARVREVRLDDTTGTATVIVNDYQLSLAIGKEGQNARLAARLTGWRIDIKSETQLEEEEAGLEGQEWAEGEWVVDDLGNQVWKPAEGGDVLTAADYSTAAETEGAAAVAAKVAAAATESAEADEVAGASEPTESEPTESEPTESEEANAEEASPVSDEGEQ
jgi:N utilization substance protein A